jgi:membrane fusion protein, protease secretion system
VNNENNERPVSQYADTNVPIRWGIRVLGIGLGGFLLWAALAPLDEGVPCVGAISIDTKRKMVQHSTGGIVKEIRVKEGQRVNAGDLLLKIDDAAVKARLEEVRQRYIGQRAAEGRLIAEQNNDPRITFHPDLLANAEDILVSQHMRNQEMLFNSRRSALDADLRGIEEAIQGQMALIQGYAGVLESFRGQQELLKEQLNGLRPLVQEGYVPRVQQQELELRLSQAIGNVANTQSNMIRAQRTVSELRQRVMARKQEYRKEVETQMAQVRLDVDADAQKLSALKDELARTEVRSPVAGQVVGLQFQTLGAVVQAGQRIMDVVPGSEGLLVEVKIPPHLIDRVQVGQPADVRFSSFTDTPRLSIGGSVESISSDLLTEPNMNPAQPGATYYLARVAITPEGTKKLGNRILTAGMPVQAVVKTGERTLLQYLLKPFLMRLSTGLKET